MITLTTIKNKFIKEFSAYKNVQLSVKRQKNLSEAIKQLEAKLEETKSCYDAMVENSDILNNVYLDAVRETKLASGEYARQERPEFDSAEKQQFAYETELKIRTELEA